MQRWRCSSSRRDTPGTRTNAEPRAAGGRGRPAAACRHLRNGAWYRSSPWRTVVRRATGRIAPPRSVAARPRTRRVWPRSGVRCAPDPRAGAAWPTSRACCALGARIDSERAKSKDPAQREAQVERRQEGGGGAVLADRAHRRRGRRRLRLLWYRYDQINKVHINAEVAAASGAPFTILVIGSDSRVGESSSGLRVGLGGHRAAQRRRAAVARDAVHQADPDHLHPPRHRRRPCCLRTPRSTAPTTASTRRTTRGPTSWCKTITANFGIPINHVVQVDFAGFQDAVNALGGIYLNFPYPAKDAYSGLNITTPGCQLLNGAQALAVARARHYEYYADGVLAVRRDERLRADPAPGRVHPVPDHLGQVEGEPADGERLHRVDPRGRHHRRRLRHQRAHRAGPGLPLLRPANLQPRRCPPRRPTASATSVTC